MKAAGNSSLPAADALPWSAPSPTTPATVAGALTTDDRGFVDSTGRCDASQFALAVGRTRRSLVVICADQNGRYEYRGVRTSDGAVLKVAAETTAGRGFLARTLGVTYAVSPAELLVASGETVISREPMIEYREPRPFPAEAGPGTHASRATAPGGQSSPPAG
jgi:hypothetical protein